MRGSGRCNCSRQGGNRGASDTTSRARRNGKSKLQGHASYHQCRALPIHPPHSMHAAVPVSRSASAGWPAQERQLAKLLAAAAVEGASKLQYVR